MTAELVAHQSLNGTNSALLAKAWLANSTLPGRYV